MAFRISLSRFFPLIVSHERGNVKGGFRETGEKTAGFLPFIIYIIYTRKKAVQQRSPQGGYNGFAAREISGVRSDGMRGICRYEGNGGVGRGKNLGGKVAFLAKARFSSPCGKNILCANLTKILPKIREIFLLYGGVFLQKLLQFYRFFSIIEGLDVR